MRSWAQGWVRLPFPLLWYLPAFHAYLGSRKVSLGGQRAIIAMHQETSKHMDTNTIASHFPI